MMQEDASNDEQPLQMSQKAGKQDLVENPEEDGDITPAAAAKQSTLCH